VYEIGDEHGLKTAWSSEHSNVEPVSVDVKVNVAAVIVDVPAGPDVIVVSGGVVSDACTVHDWLAGLGSRLPAASRACTRNSCEPGETVYETGEEQGLNPAWSSEHSKLEPVSLDVNVKVAPVLVVVAGGPEAMVVWGADVSTVNVREAGVASVFPAASLARTWKVREPLASDDVV
jgi:hypothetical protein